jgi:hypothetical protein
MRREIYYDGRVREKERDGTKKGFLIVFVSEQ